MNVHHINGDPRDNNLGNLALVTGMLELGSEVTVKLTNGMDPSGVLRSVDENGLVIVPRSGLPITIGWPIVAGVSL